MQNYWELQFLDKRQQACNPYVSKYAWLIFWIFTCEHSNNFTLDKIVAVNIMIIIKNLRYRQTTSIDNYEVCNKLFERLYICIF